MRFYSKEIGTKSHKTFLNVFNMFVYECSCLSELVKLVVFAALGVQGHLQINTSEQH